MSKQHDHDELALRRQARAEQAEVVRRRLDRHRAIAERLLSTPAVAGKLITQAQAMVDRWRSERLCSDDFNDAWSAVLAKEPAEVAAAIVSDCAHWNALRQCSPFVGDLHVAR
jgi:hypothetical protein